MTLVAGAPDGSGHTSVSVTGPVYFTTNLQFGQGTLCTRVDSCTGTLYCNGGANVDVNETLDSLKAGLTCMQTGTPFPAYKPYACSNNSADNMCGPNGTAGACCCSNACEGVGVGSGNPIMTQTGVKSMDSGPGALLLTCTQKSLQGAAGVNCSTQNYSTAATGTQAYTTGTDTAIVTNHCVGSGAPASKVPTFSKTGQNFSCANWTTPSGPSTLVFSIPTEEPTTFLTGDGSNVGVWSGQ